MLLNILLVIEIIVSVLLIGIVLMQRSEGGALGMGGGPSGFMTARGAGDLLTRMTWILGAMFFAIALILTIVSGRERGASSVVDRLKVNAIDPNSLNQPPANQPPAGATPQSAPAPLSAPTPTVSNPFAADAPAQAAPPAGALTAPLPTAPAPAPK